MTASVIITPPSLPLAEQKREDIGADIPIVGTGHLFAAGGQTVDGDGVRELYVGSLAHVTAGIFPACFNYLALGHLHVPQSVNGSDAMRYSGSPLPMGFGEAKQQKSVCLVEFHSTAASVQLVDVPVFQALERVAGDWPQIQLRPKALNCRRQYGLAGGDVYDRDEVIGDLRERLEARLPGSAGNPRSHGTTASSTAGAGNRQVQDEALDDFRRERGVRTLPRGSGSAGGPAPELNPSLPGKRSRLSVKPMCRRNRGRLTMRILNIRFKNLNSLAGEWCIDLTHPAFVSDGIFAITGPTGAGKTTILDADLPGAVWADAASEQGHQGRQRHHVPPDRRLLGRGGVRNGRPAVTAASGASTGRAARSTANCRPRSTKSTGRQRRNPLHQDQ